ncbi:MAG: PAS domain-containing protein [Burkholderiales bacterium]|nr:PAS domain-containing protein [Burkholderiales bacterium]
MSKNRHLHIESGGASVRIQFAAVALMALLPALVVLGLQVYEVAHRSRAHEGERTSAVLQQVVRSAEAGLGEARQSLDELRRIAMSGTEGCGERLRELVRSRDSIASAVIADATGEVVCDSAATRSGPRTVASRSLLGEALASSSYVVSAISRSRITGRRVIAVGQALRDGDGRPRGAVFAGVEPAVFLRQDMGAALPPGSAIVVLDRHGGLIDHHIDTSAPAPGAQVIAEGPVERLRQMIAAGMAPPDSSSFDPYYRVFSATSRAGTEGAFHVAVIAPRVDVPSGADERAWPLVVASMLIIALGVACGWHFTNRLFLRPIAALHAFARQAQRGETPPPLRLPRSAALELHRTAAVLNEAMEQLARNRDALEARLQQSNDTLLMQKLFLHTLRDGVAAVDMKGNFLVYNDVIAKIFPGRTLVPTEECPGAYGAHDPETGELIDYREMPVYRAWQGKRGRMDIEIRNARFPRGRIFRHRYQPLVHDGRIIGASIVLSDVDATARLERRRKADMQTMQVLNRRLEAAAAAATIGYWELDAASGQLWWSRDCYRIFGIPQGQAVSLPDLADAVHPDDRTVYAGLQARMSTHDGPYEARVRIYTQTGEIRWLLIQGRPTATGGAQATHTGIYKDVTERQLQSDQNDMLMRAVQKINDLVMIFQTSGNDIAEAQCLFVNDAMRAALGSQPSVAVLQQRLRRSDGTRQVQMALDLGSARRFSAQLVPADSVSARWLDVEINPLRHPFAADDLCVWIVMARDVTEQHHFEQANRRLLRDMQRLNETLESEVRERTLELEREKSYYKALADNIPQYLWRYEESRGLTYVNRRWSELIGSQDPLRDSLSLVRKYMHPDDLAEMRSLLKVHARTRTSFKGTHRFLRNGVYDMTTAYVAAPILDAQGNVESWVGLDIDISDRIKAEAELRESNAFLQSFCYSVSHDLRSPLSLIDGFSNLAIRQLPPSAGKAAAHVRRVKESASHMSEIIEGMLSLAKLSQQELRREPVDLSALCEAISQRYAARFADRHVTVRIAPGMQASADQRLVAIALDNFFSNSWKFTAQQQQACIEVGQSQENVFFIRDNGAGFDAGRATRLFEMFERMHDSTHFEGTGIGLAIVHRIVNRHEGKIWVEAREGHGATFFFTLGPDHRTIA